jgi:hypothetical protein
VRTDIRGTVRSGAATHRPKGAREPVRYYLGVDWADQEHAVWGEDETGAKVWARTIPQTVAGWAEWGRWLHEQRAAGIELWAGIEKPAGRVVDFLLEHGVVVYPINPRALAAARVRFRTSGAKSDPFDARVAAGFLRTDHAHLQPLQPGSAAAQELKLLTRDYQRLVRQRTRVLNQLTAALKEYYPRALELCEDLTTGLARAFLQRFPTPETLTLLTAAQWRGWTQERGLGVARTGRALGARPTAPAAHPAGRRPEQGAPGQRSGPATGRDPRRSRGLPGGDRSFFRHAAGG